MIEVLTVAVAWSLILWALPSLIENVWTGRWWERPTDKKETSE